MYSVSDDPIFTNLHLAELLRQHAELKGVRLYLGDAFPISDWLRDGCPIAVTNSIFVDRIPNQRRIVCLPSSFYGLYHYSFSLDSDIVPNRDYNCFMNRMDPIRQSWLYLLVRRNLLDLGHVSFNMEIERLPGCGGRDRHAVFQEQFEQYCSNFQAEHELVTGLVPYRNFDDSRGVAPACYDSKLSVVLETYFDQNSVITYTEKTFRALQIPRPWLLFSHRHAVKHLRIMGFDTLDDMIDHDQYDRLDRAIDRQTKILDMMMTVAAQDWDRDRLRQAARHNQLLMKKFADSVVQDGITSIDQAAKISMGSTPD